VEDTSCGGAEGFGPVPEKISPIVASIGKNLTGKDREDLDTGAWLERATNLTKDREDPFREKKKALLTIWPIPERSFNASLDSPD